MYVFKKLTTGNVLGYMDVLTQLAGLPPLSTCFLVQDIHGGLFPHDDVY